MRYYKHIINECDCGGVSAPMQTVNNTVGIGNPTPPQMSGSTAAEMTDPRCIGSGDKFGSGEAKPKRKFKYKKKKKMNEGFADALDSSLIDYSSELEKQDEFYRMSTLIENDFLYKHIIVNFEHKQFRLDSKCRNVFYYIDKNDENYQIHLIYPKTNLQCENYFIIVTPAFESLKELPYKIVECQGSLFAENLGLTTLNNFPDKIDGRFYCQHNKLHTLEGGPSVVHDIYNAQHNLLKNLKGMPIEILKKRDYMEPFLDLANNNSLKSKEGLVDVSYEIKYPKIFYRYNTDILPKNFISEEEYSKIYNGLKNWSNTIVFNRNNNTIMIDGKIRISKTPKSNYHLAIRWNLDTSHPGEAGFDKNWDADALIEEFIKRKEKGTF